eukprot:gnl/TRDRNA2_/TRDRNA2_181862_c0_seq1.p1 gnl/TRDRNA2_/TRDRNA2_181862_c0~~gnl/TRDRNA2_/TRDRNA2_181862_c0_seq1.p1  ORF type:complete len:329 (+),score=62.43 gnl/TRDRNA2_/TRDRNA2_181862_c0_seq1:57-989(+)
MAHHGSVSEGAEGAAAAPAPAGARGSAFGMARKKGREPVEEIVDELAQETKRTTLLDRVETQLKVQQTMQSRLLFHFALADVRKIQSQVEDEFNSFRRGQDKGAGELNGLLLWTQSVGGVHFLEGPTELLFKTLEFFQGLSQEVVASTGHGEEASQQASKQATTAAPKEPRPALIGAIRILYFTELHGVQTCAGWCSLAHPGKQQGGAQVALEDSNCPDLTFGMYKKFLLLSQRVKQSVGDNAASTETLVGAFRKASDGLPTVDELMGLSGKNAGEFFFSYQEFHKVFIAPFHLVLHSELLWPMPAALSY